MAVILSSGWEISARPLANASENLAGRVANKPGQVEFCIGYIRDCPVRASAKKFWFPSLKLVIFKLISRIDILSINCEIALKWMLQDLTDD